MLLKKILSLWESNLREMKRWFYGFDVLSKYLHDKVRGNILNGDFSNFGIPIKEVLNVVRKIPI